MSAGIGGFIGSGGNAGGNKIYCGSQSCGCHQGRKLLPLVGSIDPRISKLREQFLKEVQTPQAKSGGVKLGSAVMLSSLPAALGGLSALGFAGVMMAPIALVFGGGYYLCNMPRKAHQERIEFLIDECLKKQPNSTDAEIIDYIQKEWNTFEDYVCSRHDTF